MAAHQKSQFSSLNAVDNVTFTGVTLGKGAYGCVEEADWNGTVCAAKRIHELFLQDESPGAFENLMAGFEFECRTWSQLRHPGVVQFLGVYFDVDGPVLMLEKMDTSLRKYLEYYNKEEFPLHLKASVLRQVSQALAYLHGQNPPLVHHDLSSNNILLNAVSFVTKVTDFGMSRAIDPSSLSRKSSIKGTVAFMPPEALQKIPRYDVKLDIFSFGSVIEHTLTHEWPDPEPPNRYEGEKLIALDEFQRRERYVEMFTAQEKQLFLPIVRRCLENRPDKRPSSVMLVQELRCIESSLPSDGHVAAPIEQLYQQLAAKGEECRQKDAALRQKDEIIREKEIVLKKKDEALRKKDETLRKKDEALREKDELVRQKDEELKEKDKMLRNEGEAVGGKDTTNQQPSLQTQSREIQGLCQQLQAIEPELEKTAVQNPVCNSVTSSVSSSKGAFRDWTTLGDCLETICHTHGGRYLAVGLSKNGMLAVTDRQNSCVHLFTDSYTLICSFGQLGLGHALNGVCFDRNGNIWVADSDHNRVVVYSQDGYLLRVTEEPQTKLQYPSSVLVSAEGIAYVCDCGNHRVVAFDESGKVLFEFGSRGNNPGCFGFLRDLTIGSCGDVYVTDRDKYRVSVFTRHGQFLRSFETVHEPTCIATSHSGHVLVTSFSSSSVVVYTREGDVVHEIGGYSASRDHRQLWSPWGVVVTLEGAVYVADCKNGRILVF